MRAKKDLEHLPVVRVQVIFRRHLSFVIGIPESAFKFRPHPLERFLVDPAPCPAKVVAVPQ